MLKYILKYSEEYTKLKTYSEIKRRAWELFDEWRNNELQKQRAVLEEGIRKKYEAELRKWKLQEEKNDTPRCDKKKQGCYLGPSYRTPDSLFLRL